VFLSPSVRRTVEFVPVGVKTDVAKQPEETAKTSDKSATEQLKGSVNVTSNPTGADVLLDGDFVGNSPAVLKPNPGKHTITVKMSGFKEWTREITVQAGSELQLSATLEK